MCVLSSHCDTGPMCVLSSHCETGPMCVLSSHCETGGNIGQSVNGKLLTPWLPLGLLHRKISCVTNYVNTLWREDWHQSTAIQNSYDVVLWQDNAFGLLDTLWLSGKIGCPNTVPVLYGWYMSKFALNKRYPLAITHGAVATSSASGLTGDGFTALHRLQLLDRQYRKLKCVFKVAMGRSKATTSSSLSLTTNKLTKPTNSLS